MIKIKWNRQFALDLCAEVCVELMELILYPSSCPTISTRNRGFLVIFRSIITMPHMSLNFRSSNVHQIVKSRFGGNNFSYFRKRFVWQNSGLRNLFRTLSFFSKFSSPAVQHVELSEINTLTGLPLFSSHFRRIDSNRKWAVI